VSPFSAAPSGVASPFGAATGNKLSSFASSGVTSPTKPSGFASTENKTGSAFAGAGPAKASPFGLTTTIGSKPFGQSASGFATFGGSNSKGFGTGTAITGLGNTIERPFGSKESGAKAEKAENEDGEEGTDNEDDNEGEEQNGSERRSSQPLLQSQGPPETGEENEDNVYTGRAKLYTLAGETGKKSWQERGVGAIKLNMTRDEPRKARFVLRADGTHRLLLNAALTAKMRFGNPEGKEPEDGKLLFTAPTATGEVESHLLKASVGRLYIYALGANS
jgi:Ran-binding protein 3